MLLNAQMAEQNHSNPAHALGTSSSLTKSDERTQHIEWLQAISEDRDKDAFSALFHYYAPRIKSFLMKGGMSDAVADELAQETMLTIWNKAGAYNPTKAAPSTWIFTIARNKKIDLLRKHSRFYRDDSELETIEDTSLDQNQHLQTAQENEALMDVINALPEEQADLLHKSFFEDKSHQEIADETGIALGTVKSRIRLALERLRKSNKVKALW